MLEAPTIRQIPATRSDVFAFRIAGKVTAHDMHAMAAFMGEAFEARGKVDMLMILDEFEGSEFGAGLDRTNIRTRFKALADVRRYAVVGAPHAAERLIDAMAHVTPIDAKTFEADEAAVLPSSTPPRPSDRPAIPARARRRTGNIARPHHAIGPDG